MNSFSPDKHAKAVERVMTPGATTFAQHVPHGWTVADIGDGEIVVQAPNANLGGITLTEKDKTLANRLLYALGRAMLDA
jgi:hypothetical protein